MSEPRRLFLHCVSGLPSQRTPGHQPERPWYPERALLLASAGDVVCLPGPVDVEHLGFLNELGVGPLPGGVVDLGGERGGPAEASLAARLRGDQTRLASVAGALGSGDAVELYPYAVTSEIYAVADALEAAGAGRVRVIGGDPSAVRCADQKHLVRAMAVDLGVPVAPGEVVRLPTTEGRRPCDLEPLRGAIARQLRWTGRVIVRGTAGVAGSSVYVVGRGGATTDEILRRIGARSDNRIYLVEAMVDLTVSPNLRYRIDCDGSVTYLGVTDQRWGQPLAHAGNLFPSTARTVEAMKAWAHALGGRLARSGYAGDVGFDFVEYRDPMTDTPRAFLAEVNPRVNGASYPSTLLDGLNRARREAGREAIPAFASGMLTTRSSSFRELREALGDLLYTHARGAGVVPYALGCLTIGRCGAVALAQSREEALALFAEAQTALEVACVTW